MPAMKLKFHEIELYVKDPEASKRFYHEVLGPGVDVDQEGLKVSIRDMPGWVYENIPFWTRYYRDHR